MKLGDLEKSEQVTATSDSDTIALSDLPRLCRHITKQLNPTLSNFLHGR